MITTKKRAWVIRWEDVTTSPIQRKVIAIMDSRISGERIRWFVEQFYMTQTSTPTEMILYARDKQRNPDKAKFMNNSQMECMGYISCGHQPRIIATIVEDVKVEDPGDGTQHVTWTDIPLPPPVPPGLPRYRSADDPTE
jgi:hypothetical protein